MKGQDKIKTFCLIIIISNILITAFILIHHFCTPTPKKESNYYPMTAVVVSVDNPADIVTIKDCNGNIWEFFGTEDWMIGDICTCIMYDNKTPLTIYDDEIYNTRYNGTFEEFGH